MGVVRPEFPMGSFYFRKWAILEKIQTGGLGGGVGLLELNFQICHFTPKNSGENKFAANLCDTPWKFQGQKPKPMKIPHEFVVNTPGNSTSFLIDTWNFHMLFLQYPQKFNSPLPLPFFLICFLQEPNGKCFSQFIDKFLKFQEM